MLSRGHLASGAVRRRLRGPLRGSVLVLMYHRVLPERERDSFSAPGIIVTPETFDKHLGWIRKHLQPISPVEFREILDGGTAPSGACLVTFDDGWYDNLAYALPILESHGVPAIVFASTGFIGTADCFWQERMSRLLFAAWQAGPRGLALLELAAAQSTASLPAPAARPAIRDCVTGLKGMSHGGIRDLASRIESALAEFGIMAPSDFGDDRFLTWPELAQLASSRCITIGSHATTHVPMPQLPPDAQASEIAASRTALEARLGAPIEWFAYPNGDHDHISMTLVREAGFLAAFSTLDGPVVPGQDRFALNRINVHEGAAPTESRLLCRVAGLM